MGMSEGRSLAAGPRAGQGAVIVDWRPRRQTTMTANGKLTTLNPVGFAPKITRKELAPRLDTLHGKTAYLVDCRFEDSAASLRQLAACVAAPIPPGTPL